MSFAPFVAHNFKFQPYTLGLGQLDVLYFLSTCWREQPTDTQHVKFPHFFRVVGIFNLDGSSNVCSLSCTSIILVIYLCRPHDVKIRLVTFKFSSPLCIMYPFLTYLLSSSRYLIYFTTRLKRPYSRV